jgi:hypothetical protein
MAEIEAKTFSHLFPYEKLPCICTVRLVRGKQTAVAGVFAAVTGFPNIDNTLLSLNTYDSDLPCEDVLCGEGW